MMSPDFFLIGAPRCGTHSVAKWLSKHDDVFLPKSHGIQRFATDLKNRISDRSLHDKIYEKIDTPCIGEASPWYLYSSAAIDNILEENPSAKFIVCLRNPVEMAWALHQHYVAAQYEHFVDFNTAWAMSHLRALGRGSRYLDPKLMDYASVCALGAQVQKLFRKVPASQVFVVFYDDLNTDPEAELQRLEGFLQISSGDRSKFKLSEALYVRSLPGLHGALRHLHIARYKIFGLTPFKSRLLDWMDRKNRVRSSISKMPSDISQKLIGRMKPDIKLLSQQTGRDLSHWMSVKPLKTKRFRP